MKKTSFIVIFLCFMLFNACNNVYYEEQEAESSETVLKSGLTGNEFNKIFKGIDSLISKEIQSRSVDGNGYITEENAKEVLSPLAVEGENLRDSILKDITLNPELYPENALDSLTSLTDDQLAIFAFAIYGIEEGGSGTRGANFWDSCVWKTFGIGKGLFRYVKGTRILMTARTGFVILRAFAIRTIGWVGAAYYVYEYVQCTRKQ